MSTGLNTHCSKLYRGFWWRVPKLVKISLAHENNTSCQLFWLSTLISKSNCLAWSKQQKCFGMFTASILHAPTLFSEINNSSLCSQVSLYATYTMYSFNSDLKYNLWFEIQIKSKAILFWAKPFTIQKVADGGKCFLFLTSERVVSDLYFTVTKWRLNESRCVNEKWGPRGACHSETYI